MKKKILIVDDEESIRFTFQSFLSREGYEVLTADNFASATGMISKNDPDVLFVDIILGRKNGLDLLREIKSRGLHCPVVMITGKPDIETAAEALRMGAFDYLPKPIKKEVLIHITRQAVAHKNIQDEKVAVEAEKEKYRLNLEAVFRSLKDGIVVVDDSFEIQDMNATTLNLCGLDPIQMTGKPLDDLLLPCAQTCRMVLKQTLNTKETIREYRVECQHPDHPNQVVSLTCSPLLDLNDQSIGAVLVIRDITNLVDLERKLKEQHQFHSIVGKSKKMQELYRLVEDLADLDTTVLITGESGTGKELVANALHHTGHRAFKPQVKVNCSALVENLLESELFGHVRGAYTGAVTTKIGRFEKAHQGTIFLDEIGGLSPGVQMKLLRVLQEKEFERVGDTTPIKADVRVITSTNADLKEKVRKGEFRMDLYYRLKVVELNLPPLRDRREDIPLLWEHFIRLFNKRFKKQIWVYPMRPNGSFSIIPGPAMSGNSSMPWNMPLSSAMAKRSSRITFPRK
jgi:two-component system response regulator HydG